MLIVILYAKLNSTTSLTSIVKLDLLQDHLIVRFSFTSHYTFLNTDLTFLHKIISSSTTTSRNRFNYDSPTTSPPKKTLALHNTAEDISIAGPSSVALGKRKDVPDDNTNDISKKRPHTTVESKVDIEDDIKHRSRTPSDNNE
jgi:hypothetical protein